MAENYENYGDVALNLPADWSRKAYERDKFIKAMVGHTNGKADAFLTKQPKAKHQFSWCHPKDEDKYDLLREKGFDYVRKADWSIDEKLWTWTPEGMVRRDGDLLMARPAELYYEEQEEERRKKEDLDKRANRRLAEVGVAGARGHDGERLIPISR